MLRAVHSHRVEDLRDALLEALPPADPFAPSTIVIGSHLVARWLTKEIALARGIASGLEMLTFDRFVEQTWAQDAAGRRANLGCVDRKRLGAAFASVLADDRIVRELGPVAAYLAAAPAPGDRAGPRRVQLAEHLAELAWSYMLTRPDWVPGLVAGHVPGELAEDETAQWQVRLIHAALARLSTADSVRVPAPMLPWVRRRAGLAAPQREPISVFGMSFLARAQLEALTDLAATTDVTVYVLDPCEELWDDVLGRTALARATGDDDAATAAAATTSDPLPLVLWGRPVRDTLSSLVERTSGDLEARFATPSEGRTARDRLLVDVRARRGPGHEAALVAARDPADGGAGVTVLACPNPRREIEVIATEVRRLLDADPSLCAHEIAVWIGGDAEKYLAQAPSAFEAVGVPCHLIDAPIDDRGRIGEAVLALLELPTGAMSRRELLRVMTHPAVLAGHPHVDAADWVRWTERLGIVHGADGESHAGTYLADHPGHFHWEQGVRRLALGAFMVGDRGDWRGPVQINGDLLAPEEVRADQQASAATYALLVRSLCADAEWLGERMAPLSAWADVLAALVDDYLAPRDEESRRDLERVRGMLANLATFDIDGRPVGFREAREYVVRMFASARANRGEPLAGGVMIAPLAAMRAVPFRVAFVAGLDEGAFPASEHGSPLDLRSAVRAGDVSPRDRDRAAFLDVLLCARDALYLSYVAVEPKSGQPLGPSSIVLELADALAPYLGAPSSREALASITARYPLHRFADATSSRPDVTRERWALAVRDALHAHLRAANHPIPDADGQLALLSHASQAPLRAALGIHDAPLPSALTQSRSITISNLRGFLEYPIQAWALAVLGFDELPDDSTIEHSDEPFHLGRAERTMLLREVLAAHLREPAGDLEARYDATVRDLQLRGQFPVGVFAEAARALDLSILERWRTALGPLARTAAIRIGFGRAWSRGAQLRPPLQIELPGARAIRVIGQTELLLDTGERRTSVVALVRTLDKKTHYHIRGALDHVVLAAAGLAPSGHVHKLLGADGGSFTVTHDPWSPAEAREYLATLIADLLDAAHGYLLPFDGLVRALAGGKPAAKYRDMTQGLGFGPIERADGLAVPPDATEIARRRLAPLVERMRGDHGFEVQR